MSSSDGTGAKRVLIVEDDVMIRMLIEDMLAELGYAVAGQAAKVDDALAAAQREDFDIAILDLNLGGRTAVPVAEALAARGLPFIFATGYGDQVMPDTFRDRPMLKKPFQLDGLRRTLDAALSGKR